LTGSKPKELVERLSVRHSRLLLDGHPLSVIPIAQLSPRLQQTHTRQFGNVLATAILLRDETSLAKKFSVILGNGPAFHGLRSWSFEDKRVPNQEIGNEELLRNSF
jgi:hypothetical protein